MLRTPCHTSGHVSYYIENILQPNKSIVFTGDTLFLGEWIFSRCTMMLMFSAGCGRFFEGGADDMLNSFKTIMKLPSGTLVCSTSQPKSGDLIFSLRCTAVMSILLPIYNLLNTWNPRTKQFKFVIPFSFVSILSYWSYSFYNLFIQLFLIEPFIDLLHSLFAYL